MSEFIHDLEWHKEHKRLGFYDPIAEFFEDMEKAQLSEEDTTFNESQYTQHVESVGDYIESKRCPLCGIVPTEELYKAMEKLEEEPETKWIPCSERLPEEDGMYLVSVNPYYVPPKDYTTDALYFHKGVWKYMDILKVHHAIVPELVLREFEWPIIAWMPLPEPYQEVKE